MKFETYAHKIVINYKQNLYRSMHTYAHIRNKLARTRRLVHAHLRGGNSIRGGGGSDELNFNLEIKQAEA